MFRSYLDRLSRFVVVGLLVASSTSLHAVAADGNGLMDFSRDGELLVCANRDSGTVSVVRTRDWQKTGEVAVGQHPEGVCFLGDSHRVAVALHGDDQVVVVDASTSQVTQRIDVFDEPYAVAANRAATRLYVTLDYPGHVEEFEMPSGRLLRSFPVDRFSRGLALAGDESRLYVTSYYTGDVVAVQLADGKEVDRWPGISNDNLARQVVVHPRRGKLYVPHIRSRVTAVHGEGSIFPYVSVIDTAPGEGKRRRRLPMDAFQGNLVTSNPWDCAISPDGRHFYVVFAGTDDMFACDVIDDDYRELSVRRYMKLGKNPRAVRVSPDGRHVVVYQALDFSLAVFDSQSLARTATVTVTENPLGAEILRGKILFYSALQPMAGRRWISCASCHPDGEQDGRTWHNPEGLRNTQWLAGLRWTHPVHWSADRDEVQDFEHTIRGPLMQGQGLARGKLNPELGEPLRGLSADLDALAAYTNSHRWPLSPHAKGGLTEAAKRGREVFHSTQTKCATCHAGPLFTDSRPDKPVKHDVGTGADDPREKLGPAFDTPTLVGVYRTAPYLHHGRAATLRDVLTTYNAGDKHGATSQLTAAQVDDLVAFLESLPYESPDAAAASAGLPKVER